MIDGIIITFPTQFLLDLVGRPWPNYVTGAMDMRAPRIKFRKEHALELGAEMVTKQIGRIQQDPDTRWWWHSIGSKPTQEVLYAYITMLGRIRWRATIAQWEPGHEKQFPDGRKFTAKHWMVLSNFIDAPHEIPQKGFQGFRYTDKLF